jgi:glutathione S-transferase
MSTTLVSHALCPYVQRAVITLREKGVAFERIDIDLEHKPDWFLAQSPLGKTPILVTEGTVLFESSAICEYLDETAPGVRLHPERALDRARHRAWIELGSAILGDIWAIEIAADEAATRRAANAVHDKLVRIEGAIVGPYFAGERFSLVDAVFAPAFCYFDVFDALVDLGVFRGLPNVTAWRTALTSRPSVASAVGDDYGALLRAFLDRQGAWLAKRS